MKKFLTTWMLLLLLLSASALADDPLTTVIYNPLNHPSGNKLLADLLIMGLEAVQVDDPFCMSIFLDQPDNYYIWIVGGFYEYGEQMLDETNLGVLSEEIIDFIEGGGKFVLEGACAPLWMFDDLRLYNYLEYGIGSLYAPPISYIKADSVTETFFQIIDSLPYIEDTPRGSNLIFCYDWYPPSACPVVIKAPEIDGCDGSETKVILTCDSNCVISNLSYQKFPQGQMYARAVIGHLADWTVGAPDESAPSTPEVFALSQNYPNPFNASTMIEYSLPHPADVTLDIYDILGRKVETLLDCNQTAGYHQITWHASDISSGIYFYKIQAGDIVETKSMLLLK